MSGPNASKNMNKENRGGASKEQKKAIKEANATRKKEALKAKIAATDSRLDSFVETTNDAM